MVWAVDQGEEEEEERTIEIRTIAGGHNLGRKYRLRAETRNEATRWAEILQQCVRKAIKLETRRVKKHPWQLLCHQARKVHGGFSNDGCALALQTPRDGAAADFDEILHCPDGNPFQQFFGLVIMSSFLISLVRAEMVPEKGSEADGVFEIIDLFFTGLFTLELVTTLLAHWFFEFWTHGCVCVCVCVCVYRAGMQQASAPSSWDCGANESKSTLVK